MDLGRILPFLPVAFSTTLFTTMHAAFHLGMRRGRRRARVLDRAPRVSILKPLAGMDDELLVNLRSFGAIDYPSFELLLGIASVDDAALGAAKQLVFELDGRIDVRIVHTDPEAATNPKVAQLIGLEEAATGPIVVVSDANVRVQPGYLTRLVADLMEPGVGLVSSVVAGTGERTIGAMLENLHLGGNVAPGVVAADVVSGRPLTIGKSMAIERRALARVGGFRRVAHVLAEDHLLGRIFRAAGIGVRLSLAPIENRNVVCGAARTLERHTRWAKMRRAIVPQGYWAEPLLHPLLVASITFLAIPSRGAALMVVAVAAWQMLAANLALKTVRGHALPLHWWPLEIVRVFALVACWMRGWASRSVEWRGHPFVIGEDSKITPVVKGAERRRARV